MAAARARTPTDPLLVPLLLTLFLATHASPACAELSPKENRAHCRSWVRYERHEAGSPEERACAMREADALAVYKAPGTPATLRACCLYPPSPAALADAQLALSGEGRRAVGGGGGGDSQAVAARENDCCSAHEGGVGGCENAACADLVVALGDSFCGDVEWDALCAAAATSFCPVCGGVAPVVSDNDVCAAAKPLACRGLDLPVSGGDTRGNTNTIPETPLPFPYSIPYRVGLECPDACCGPSNGPDEWFKVMGDGGNVTIFTYGFDTFIHVFEACNFPIPVACNDDAFAFDVGPSLVSFQTLPNKPYFLRVGGWADSMGAFQVFCEGGRQLCSPLEEWNASLRQCVCKYGQKKGGGCKKAQTMMLVRVRVVPK